VRTQRKHQKGRLGACSDGVGCSYILGLGLRSRLASALLGARLARLALSCLARLATAASAALASLAIATAAIISPSLSATAVVASTAIIASLLIAALVHHGRLHHLADHIDVHNSAINLSLIEILKKNQGASIDFNRVQKRSSVRHRRRERRFW
jgi:hypothetical protein